jgi:hypothetical protein
MDHQVMIAGIPLPSSAPWFLLVVGLHVTAGIVAVIAGLLAVLSPKTSGRHPRAGGVYFWSLGLVCLTMTPIVIFRWPTDNVLGLLGVLALAGACLGRRVRRRAAQGWQCVHIPSMGVSYIALLTAFYVDNGPHLPLWNRLPMLVLWVLPAFIGLPLTARAWWKRCPPSRRRRPPVLDAAT